MIEPGQSRSEPASPPPVFLERQSYRRRRLTDAARLMPLLGAFLFAIPLLWPGPDDTAAGDMPTSRAILYIFAVWAGLIVFSAWFGRLAREWSRADPPGPSEQG